MSVAPHAGAWIETLQHRRSFASATTSLPTRERGLKRHSPRSHRNRRTVAPHAGAWIETGRSTPPVFAHRVAPHAGAWIETSRIETCRSPVTGVAPHAGAWIE